MERAEFISNLKELEEVESVSGVVYSIDAVNDKFVIGTRQSTQEEFKIKIDGLYEAYNDVSAGNITMTTTALRSYVPRTQSPALAIIKAILPL